MDVMRTIATQIAAMEPMMMSARISDGYARTANVRNGPFGDRPLRVESGHAISSSEDDVFIFRGRVTPGLKLARHL